MLRQRVITAIVLLLVMALCLWLPAAWPFLALLAVACGCAAWEWLRLTVPPAWGKILPVVGGVVVFGICAMWTADWTADQSGFGRGESVAWLGNLVYLSAVIWVLGAVAVVVQGDAQPRSTGSLAWTAFAPIALLSAWAALAIMYLQFSAWFVISLLITVWVADVAAYFAGRAIGKRKLAPRVSPGKTVAGAVAGVLCAVLWLVGSGLLSAGSFGAQLIAYWSLGGAIVIAALLGALSIVGDLFESLLKRRAGSKDSSQLLPGHGGVYDRIDAILPVAVCGQALLMLGAAWGVA